ncbi:sigma-70 family RNA polymerase sigma factor [Rhizobium sp. CC-YZS058]|uniref:sigma-70 family RNA polymerase sigma factor n=1 Tax=Rhizobium sp. CC-YZS058 TaxID=3042153 RepID=UPI002B058C57|nr:sigma-70 family RNA polymerase sigma factor [Rhizobium sp. CC-YZS058]MEA3533461.1 sigma-70 family RNA polymerase sigma factor [Rhizobium sp. CC-YZS058]
MSDEQSRARLEAELIELIPALRNFAVRFHRSPNEAEDLVQETLLKSLANLHRFQEGTRLKSWMFTIMRNTFCTKFGLAKREPVGSEDCVANQPTVPPVQEWAVRGHELEVALGELPPLYRQAISLIAIDGISYEHAAERCHCPLGTMKSRVNRARAHLARRLGDDARAI